MTRVKPLGVDPLGVYFIVNFLRQMDYEAWERRTLARFPLAVQERARCTFQDMCDTADEEAKLLTHGRPASEPRRLDAPNSDAPAQSTVTVAEAADMLDRSPRQVTRLIAQGDLDATREGWQHRVTRSSVERYALILDQREN